MKTDARSEKKPPIILSMQDIIDVVGDGISVQDTQFRILYQNHIHKALEGDHVGEYCYKAYERREQVCDRCHLARSFHDGKIHRTVQSRVTDEGKFYYEIIASPVRDETGTIIAGIESVRDVTERKLMEEKLHDMSMRDDLTGLYNRRGFFTLAEQQIKMARRMKKRILVFSADLDNLKLINDTFGHKEGDFALIEAAGIIKQTVRESDIVARIGGDEFVILQLEDHAGNSEVLTQRLQNNFSRYNVNSDKPFALSVSTGISHCEPASLCSIDELLLQADKVLYEEKRSKRTV
ncbi:MAG: GGDEF domain-containing protein [Nitrospirota bacterium]|nr:GGDEF domain-containing protein [Nitrospirota bacterium]